MSREIKFKVWNPELERMYKIKKENYLGSVGIIDNFIGGKESKWMQYTGLKDKNGVEIYEGDILYVEQIEVIDPYIPHKKNVAVKYDERDTAFVFDEENGFVIGLYSMPRELEVIGNIYENPELLEE